MALWSKFVQSINMYRRGSSTEAVNRVLKQIWLKYLQYHHIAPGDPPFGQCELPQRKKHKRHGHCSKRKKERRQGLGGFVVVVVHCRRSSLFSFGSLSIFKLWSAHFIFIYFSYSRRTLFCVCRFLCVWKKKKNFIFCKRSSLVFLYTAVWDSFALNSSIQCTRKWGLRADCAWNAIFKDIDFGILFESLCII